MDYLSIEQKYKFLYDYFKEIEYAYDFFKSINGKTIQELTTEQYDYLYSCESWNRNIDPANNTNTEKYTFFKGEGGLACCCLERLGIATLFLEYDSIYIELIGPTDNMDNAVFKCDLLRINNYIEEIRVILLSLSFLL